MTAAVFVGVVVTVAVVEASPRVGGVLLALVVLVLLSKGLRRGAIHPIA